MFGPSCKPGIRGAGVLRADSFATDSKRAICCSLRADSGSATTALLKYGEMSAVDLRAMGDRGADPGDLGVADGRGLIVWVVGGIEGGDRAFGTSLLAINWAEALLVDGRATGVSDVDTTGAAGPEGGSGTASATGASLAASGLVAVSEEADRVKFDSRRAKCGSKEAIGPLESFWSPAMAGEKAGGWVYRGEGV